MIKALFLQYLLMPLIVLLLAVPAAIIKKKNAMLSFRALIVFVLVSSLVIAIPALLGFTGTDFTPCFYLLSQVIYLLLGTLFVSLYVQFLEKSVEQYKILFKLMVMLLCMLLGGYLYTLLFNFCSDVDNGYTAATSILIFPLPLLFYWVYMAMLDIPFEIYTVWQYPTGGEKMNIDGEDFTKLMVLHLECSRHFEDRDRLHVQVKAPSGMIFGQWYKMFIDDYNAKFPSGAIEYQGEQYGYDGWIFYNKRSLFHLRKYIDPDKTIADNDIREKVVIVAKRVIEHKEEKFNKNLLKTTLQEL